MGFASLPPEILRLVSHFLLKDETPSNRTLVLMAFCGVCKRWRDVGAETGEAALAFDSTDTQHGAKTTLPAFKKASGLCKRALFLGASRLLTGYSDLTLSGEAINDQMLINIAVANGPALTSLKLQGTPTVTDAGLCTLISAAPNLKLFSMEDAGQGVLGHFVPALLQHCKQLETLLIEGAESMDWPALRLSWAPAMAAAATASQDADSFPAAGPAGGRQGQQQQQQQQQQPSAFAGASSSGIPAQQHHQQLQQASLSARDSAHDVNPGSSSRSRGNSSRSSTAAPAGHMGRTQSQPSSSQAGPSSSSRHSHQQQQEVQPRLALPLAPRISSSSTCSGHSEFSSCQEEAVISDDGGSSSSSSVDARSDSTSISMPPQAVEALAAQLQQILSTNEQPQQPAAAAAGEPGAVNDSPSSSNTRTQTGRSDAAGSSSRDGQQQQQRRRRGGGGSSRPCHASLRRLRVRFANVDTLQQLLECVPGLTDLQLDGPALSVQAAAVMCPGLRRLSYLVCSPGELDAALLCLNSMRNLRALELEVKGMVLSTEQLRVIGLLPLRELCLDSHAYRQHPSMPRPQYSHLDNDGVKGLVDSICSRMRTELMPLKLSLCGATALKQEAVSALLRLPILASIDTGGCVKLTPMDRMRLVAKVKAGQGLMDKTGGAAGGAAGAAGGRLRLPHVLL